MTRAARPSRGLSGTFVGPTDTNPQPQVEKSSLLRFNPLFVSKEESPGEEAYFKGRPRLSVGVMGGATTQEWHSLTFGRRCAELRPSQRLFRANRHPSYPTMPDEWNH